MKTANRTAGKLSHTITDEVGNIIPVIDVRDGKDARAKAADMIKATNEFKGSKFFGSQFSGLGHRYN